MLFCGIVENLPHWPWDNKRFTQKKSPRLRQVHTRMSSSFFHRGITRFQAEVFLTNAKEDGSFLVRDSESLSGAYVLCLLHQSKVHQYRVLPAPDRKLHVQSETGTIQRGYSDLPELIAEYIKKGDQNGLACALIHPVAPDGSSDDDNEDLSDDEDFESPPPVGSPPAVPPHRQSSSRQSDQNKVDLHRNLARLDLSGCDSAICQSLKDYADKGIQRDMVSMNVGESELPEFTKVLEIVSQSLKRELDSFMKKIDILSDFLKVGNGMPQMHDSKKKLTGPVIPSMLEQLSRVRSDILHIQTKAQETVQLASIPSEYEFIEPVTDDVFTAGDQNPSSGPFLSSMYRPCIPQSKFEVKKIKNNRALHPVTLTVDLQNGRYSVLKQTSRDALDQTTITHENILHLIKSTKDKCHLDIILEGNRKQKYAFNDHHARENFCLQIRQMKNMHSTEAEIEQISIFAGTWNMGDTSPNQSLSTWLKCSGAGKSRDRVLGVIPHDMYVIGTQESSMSEKDWVNTVKAGLKACVLVDMELVEVCTLWGIRLVIFVKPDYKHCISRVQRSSVRTGIANALGNKGAVAIAFFFNGTSFCFINAHLTSGDERCAKRNQNYRDIIKGLTMSLGQKHLSNFDITNEFHHVFFLGDLNYRVEEKIQVILTKTAERDLTSLTEKDQLKMTQKMKAAFCGFQEADITFLPTYRFERNTPGYKYAWKKVKRTGERINAPSWCDRVLWRSYPGLFIENVAYGSSESILSSDHRPVFSSFNVGISSEFVQARGSLAEVVPVKIIFHYIEAQVKTCCKQYFQVVFYSSCLQEIYKSESNVHFQENRTGFYTVPYWQSSLLPEMKPLFGDQDFLEEQHILIAVISRDGDNESYGECVLSLKDMFSNQPKDFEYILLHQGEETGKIKGKMHVTSKSKSRSSSRKQYSFIAFDTEYHDPEVYLSDKPNLDPRARPVEKSLSLKPRPGNVRAPLRNVQSSYVGDSAENRNESLSSKLDSRAPQPLPPAQATPIVPPRKNPVMGQSSLLQGAQRGGSVSVARQTSSPPISQAPPPIPPKSKSIKGKELSRQPQTIEEWLAQLNLSCYEQNFCTSGWKSLLALNELSLPHLIDMHIEVPDHQERILASVKDLNRIGEGKALYQELLAEENGEQLHGYATLTLDAENYIDFSFSTDESGMYDTFSKPKTSTKADNRTNEPDEEVFMSLEELGLSPLDAVDKASDYAKEHHTEDEDVFMTLAEIRASPISHSRESKSKSSCYNLCEKTGKSLEVPPARHSHSGYINQKISAYENDLVQHSASKDETKIHTDYYNLRSSETEDKEISGAFPESEESFETPEYNILENVYEMEKETAFTTKNYSTATDTYDHTNQTRKRQYQSGYSHIEFSAGKSMMTVEEWLQHLDMLHYKRIFLDNGWDSLCFLNELTASDLSAIGVIDAEDQYIILKSIRSLNKI